MQPGNIFTSEAADNSGAKPRNYVRHQAGDYPKMLYRKDGFKKANSGDEEAGLVADGYSLTPVPTDEPVTGKAPANAPSGDVEADIEDLQTDFATLQADHAELRAEFEKFAADTKQRYNELLIANVAKAPTGPALTAAQVNPGALQGQAGLGPSPVSAKVDPNAKAEVKKG